MTIHLSKVAFVGIISNIQVLCVRAPWLAWLCKIPPEVIGIIQVILPPVLLAVLMMLLPILLRLLGRFEGIPTKSGLELSLMTRFFIFQVIVSVSISAPNVYLSVCPCQIAFFPHSNS